MAAAVARPVIHFVISPSADPVTICRHRVNSPLARRGIRVVCVRSAHGEHLSVPESPLFLPAAVGQNPRRPVGKLTSTRGGRRPGAASTGAGFGRRGRAGEDDPGPLTVTGIVPLERAADLLLGGFERLRSVLLRITTTTAVASAFLNNTPIVAMGIPTIINWAEERDISTSVPS